ncbi:hypothetical protein QAD02_023467 [Eretmocerus hayati]|uniref:Uncharacterized protein n=1 Tax=Eretmocerus hayati TaxID=131215 RepID=A0ACC2PXK1_9HYME|nr:hypothetical protein QAD02_023467 [Eretmocerus hayati]
MGFRNVLRCFVCDRNFNHRNVSRIDGDNNAGRREIAIGRREGFGRPPLDVTPLTRICFNCNDQIRIELEAIQNNPSVLGLNVLSQTRSSSCCICNGEEDIH